MVPVMIDDFCEICVDDLCNCEEILGNGRYGTVKRAELEDILVAVKFVEPANTKTFYRELEQLSKINHENIVQLIGASKSEPFILVLEYSEYGSLYHLIHKSDVPYNDAHSISWCLQAAKGIAYLHSMTPKPILHRDVKSLNMLLFDDRLTLKICDFGTATAFRPLMSNNVGTSLWMAPEVFKYCEYDERCDVFSWSIVLWECLMRRFPYSHIQQDTWIIMYAIVTRDERPEIPDSTNSILKDLMKKCWDCDPSMRPSMLEVVSIMEEQFTLYQNQLVPLFDLSKIRDVLRQLSFREKIYQLPVILAEEFIDKDHFVGSFSKIVRAKWNGHKVAIKSMPLGNDENNRSLYRLLSRLSHENIVLVYGITEHYELVMELSEYGTLFDTIHLYDGKFTYSHQHVISWLLQAAHGLAYLHEMKPFPILHRNIKPQNMLMFDYGKRLKLSGFTSAIEYDSIQPTVVGTAAYMAPEVIKGDNYTEKIDVYSWAIALWQCFAQEQPYKGNENIFQIIWSVAENDVRPDLSDKIPEMVRNLLTRCWHKNAEERPSITQVVADMKKLSNNRELPPLPIERK